LTHHYLVTGGAGFIGGHLIARLIETGCKITVIDDFSTGDRNRLENYGTNRDLRVIEGDIRDMSRLTEAFKGVDGVFHLAAKLSVRDCINNWLGNHSVNSTAFLGVFDLVQTLQHVPVVYASSAAVYGNRSDDLCNEDLAARPISPYGADKLACENQARAFWSVHGIPSAGLRFFNVYGPGQPATSPYSGVLTRFVKNIKSGLPPEIHGDGFQTRDFVHVSNVVDALIAAMDRISRVPNALVSNVCTGMAHRVRDIAYMIGDILKAGPIGLSYGPERPGDIRHSCGDPTYMSKTLNLEPFVTLEQGLSNWLAGAKTASVPS